jgi:hypothetical protein
LVASASKERERLLTQWKNRPTEASKRVCGGSRRKEGKKEAGGGNLEDGETVAVVGIYTPRARIPRRGTGEQAVGMR